MIKYRGIPVHSRTSTGNKQATNTTDSILLCPRQSLTVNIHCEFSSRFHSDSKRIRSGFESKRRESPRIHNVFAQQYGFANFGRVFTGIRCETLSWDDR